MSDFIRQVYQCTDGTIYNDFERAWDHERRVKYPEILMFDCFGNIVDDVGAAVNYAVNNVAEAEFVSDYLGETNGAIVYDLGRVVPHSWITIWGIGNDYILYTPKEYKDSDHSANWELHDRLRQDCDLWSELLGQ